MQTTIAEDLTFQHISVHLKKYFLKCSSFCFSCLLFYGLLTEVSFPQTVTDNTKQKIKWHLILFSFLFNKSDQNTQLHISTLKKHWLYWDFTEPDWPYSGMWSFSYSQSKKQQYCHPELERPLSLGKLIVVFYLIISEHSPYTLHLTVLWK